MTIEEFSDGFDTLVSAFFLAHPFGKPQGFNEFNEYEKSVFLTKAQEETVIRLYSGKNPAGESFERTEELRRYLNDLVKELFVDSADLVRGETYRYLHYFVSLPKRLWYIVYESADFDPNAVSCKEAYGVAVYPTTHDEYYRAKNNPFRGPNTRRVLRLDCGDGKIELVSQYELGGYFLRYLTKPEPIVLVDLAGTDNDTDSLSVDGVSTRNGCKLHEALHNMILQRAVELALASRTAIAPPPEKEPAENK